MAEEVEQGWLHRRIEKNRDGVEELRRDVVSLQVHQKFAVTHDHVKDSEERSMRYTDGAIKHTCEHFDATTHTQSKDILTEVRGLFTQQQLQFATERLAQQQADADERAKERKELRQQLRQLVVGGAVSVAVSVIAAVIIFFIFGRV